MKLPMRRLADPVWLAGIGIAGLVVVLATFLRPTNDRDPIVTSSSKPTSAVSTTMPVVDRRQAPVVNGRVLGSPSGERPVEPVGWDGGTGPIPTNNWWAPLTSGAGAPGLWPTPLMARVDAKGRTELGTSRRVERSDGTIEGEPLVALFAEFGGPPTVLGAGAFHARWSYPTTSGRTELTMVQGSPFAEFEGQGTLRLTIPALRNFPGAESQRGVARLDALRRGVIVETAVGPWVLAATPGTSVAVTGDLIDVKWPPSGGRFVAGPVPSGAGSSYSSRAVDISTNRLTNTTETVRMLPDGSAEQVLRQIRASSSVTSVWALLAHQQTVVQRAGTTDLGTLSTVSGMQPVIAGQTLTLRYPGVPMLWSPVASTDNLFGVDTGEPTPLEQLSRGSYFGGKAAATAALSSLLSDDEGKAARHLDTATQLLQALADPELPPQLVWEDRYAKPVIEPAEFGSLDALNDHQLQYGYWVLAASIVVERRPELRPALAETIELLITDYAGSGQPGTLLDRHGTWSPYNGHSWASGITPFGAGNNLESISESSAAWWAAARWMLVTGQVERAQRFIAMLTIESHVTGTAWLPDQAPTDPTMRPWSGVVWAGKIDNQTWFDPSPEAALGIRLLPLGPMSVSRYHDAASVDAARRRWAWCAGYGGCSKRWSNLLDSDSVVAGQPPQLGPDPEPSTSAAMTAWWRTLWTNTEPVFDLRCTPGAVARRFSPPSGRRGLALLVTNPGPDARDVTCWDSSGKQVWSGVAAARTAKLVTP